MTTLADKRLVRAKAAEEDLGDAKDNLIRYGAVLKDALAAKRKYEEVGERVELMPTWEPTRATGKRGGGEQYDNTYRIAVYGMYANGTPRSAIGKNICTVVRLAAPWLKPKEPSHKFLINARFELRTIVRGVRESIPSSRALRRCVCFVSVVVRVVKIDLAFPLWVTPLISTQIEIIS